MPPLIPISFTSAFKQLFPALFVLNWLFPLYGLAYAQFTAEILLAVAAVLVLRRLFRDLERGHAPAGA